MLTAIVWGASEPRSLAVTLATLVPAAIDGALREVAVSGTEDAPEARFVAEQAGCRFLAEGRPSLTVPECKGRWLLVVRSGDRVPDEWLEAALQHERSSARAARIAVLRPAMPQWRRWVTRGSTALLVSRDRVAEGDEATWSDLALRTRGRHLRVDSRRPA